MFPPLNYDEVRTSRHHYNDPIEEYETWYVQEMFTKPLMQSTPLGQDENDENEVIDTSFEKEYINEIMAKQLAENLVKKGLLNLKKQSLFKKKP